MGLGHLVKIQRKDIQMMVPLCEIKIHGGMTLMSLEEREEARKVLYLVAVLVAKVLAVVRSLHMGTRIQGPSTELPHKE